MENELPNIWWIIDPAFIKKFNEERHLDADEDSPGIVTRTLEEILLRDGSFPKRNTVNTMTSVIAIEDVVKYRQLILRTTALSKHRGDENLPMVNIVVTIPKQFPQLSFMSEIIKITRGVNSFIKPVVTFVNFEEDMVTVNV